MTSGREQLVRSSGLALERARHVRLLDRIMAKLPGIGRYTAGPLVEDVVGAVEKYSKQGIGSIANILGEHDADPSVIGVTAQQYRNLIYGMAACHGLVRPAISLKPTQFGLAHETGQTPENQAATASKLSEMLHLATGCGIFVWLDMENRNTTDFTLEFYRSLAAEKQGKLGMVLQANLRRTPQDLADLMYFSQEQQVEISVRLVRGIYREPEAVSYVSRKEMHGSFARLMRQAFLAKAGNLKVSVGTHHPDQIIRAIALRRAVPGRFRDMQFLLGSAMIIPGFLAEKGFNCTYYIPGGPRFLDYGIRRMRENPGGMVGLFLAPLMERMNLVRIRRFLDGKLHVDLDSDSLDIIDSK